MSAKRLMRAFGAHNSTAQVLHRQRHAVVFRTFLKHR